MMGYGMGGYGGYGYGTSLFGGVFQLLFLVLILAGMYLLVRWLINTGSGKQGCFISAAPAAPVTALEILKQRYARGEINRDEYERIKQDLG